MKRYLIVLLVSAMTGGTSMGAYPFVTTFEFQGEDGGYNVWNMYTVTSTDWTNANIEVYLTSGSMNHVLGGWPLAPKPEPMTLYDTGVLCPNYNPPAIAEFSEGPQEFICSWGDVEDDGPGTWWTGILAFTPDSNGTINGSSYGDCIGCYEFYEYIIVDGAIIPEPAMFALLGVGTFLTLLRRRRVSTVGDDSLSNI